MTLHHCTSGAADRLAVVPSALLLWVLACWTSLFDSKTLGKFVVVLSAEEGGRTGGNRKKYFEGGMRKTTSNPNGYIRTSECVTSRGSDVPVAPGPGFPDSGSLPRGGEMIYESTRPVGEWNTLEMYSEEGRVASVLNDTLIGLAQSASPRIGHIGIEAEGAKVEFRNIKVRRHAPLHHLWQKGPKPAPGAEQ